MEINGDVREVNFIDLNERGEVLPPKTDKILLVDADTLAYTTCLALEESEDILPQEFYSEMEWDAIVNMPGYDSENSVLYTIDYDKALDFAIKKLKRIMDLTGCVNVELHFTDNSKQNFRYQLFPKYKANRTARRPLGLYRLKQDLVEKFGGNIHENFEADDIVVYKKLMYPNKYILAAIDKDVLNSVEGKHFNYYESSKFNKSMHWHTTSLKTSREWRYIQTLMGDKIDNIEGLRGIGPKKAQKIIDSVKVGESYFDKVCEAYEKQNKTEQDALLTLNLVDMKLLRRNESGKYYIKLNTIDDLKNDIKET